MMAFSVTFLQSSQCGIKNRVFYHTYMPPIQREKLPVIIKSLYGMFRNDPMDKRIYGIPVHEQMILLWSNVPGFFFRSGPLKSSHLQPLIFL